MKHIKKFNERHNGLPPIEKVIEMSRIEKVILEDGQSFSRHSSVDGNEEWYDENNNYIRNDNISHHLEDMYQSRVTK